MVILLLAAAHKVFGIRCTSDTKLNCWVAPLQNKILKPKFTKGNIQKKKKEGERDSATREGGDERQIS
jgi:hypothetical protein